MKLTREGEYGIRCVLFLAGSQPGHIINRREIATAMNIPYQFLGKIGRRLADAGIIQIAQGARGGYKLQRPADQVTLLEVVEALDGGISLNECVLQAESCEMVSFCPVHPVWAEARRELRRILSKADFATLAGKGGRPVLDPGQTKKQKRKTSI